MKYLFKHNNHTDYSSNPPAVIPSVSWCNHEDEIHWGADKTYDKQYFTIESLDDNNIISITQGTQTDTITLQISKDLGNTWETAITTAPETTTQITTLNYGERAIIKGTNATFTTVGTLTGGIHFNTSKRINIFGNIGSLVYGDNFASQTALPNSNYIFRGLFGTDSTTHENGEILTKVVDASKLILLNPTGTYAYAYMFYYCETLIKIPQHYTSALQDYTYQGLFSGCTGLTNINIELPATVLKEGCYREMFSGCTNLISAPTFTIGTAATGCCYSMFYNCTSLLSENTSITINATTTYENCYRSMFSGCSSLTTCPISSLPASAINSYSYAFMFHGCTSMTTVPTMTVGSIVSGKTYAMENMFQNCTSLVTIPQNTIKLNNTNTPAATFRDFFAGCTNLIDSGITHIAATSCGSESFTRMFQNCSSLTTMPSFTNTSFGNDNGFTYMFEGCTSLQTVNCQLASTTRKACYMGMFKGCTSLITAPALTATVLTDSCYKEMFSGCTSLTGLSAPITIDTAAANCCYSMFYNCTSLLSENTSITINATTCPNHCYRSMFNGCTSLTTTPIASLPSTNVGSYSYAYMFQNCTSMTTAPTFTINSIGNTYACQYMFKNCYELLSVDCHLNATTLTAYCYRGMFSYCRKLTVAPELPALTLASMSYSTMFEYTNIMSIKAAFTTPANSNYTNAWVTGVPNESTRTFYKNKNATWTQTGNSAIPTKWTVILYDPDE